MELINCNKWKTLCSHIYDTPSLESPTEPLLTYVPMDHIHEFLNNSDDYICKGIVSACSDYGICYQNEYPVSLDMKKWFDFVNIDENLQYNPLFLPPRCDVTNCKITDAYSIKMHVFTKSTISKLPFSIWFCTNCNLPPTSSIVHIPFGIPDWSEKLILEARSKNRHKETNKDIGIYINFQNNTAERVAIKDKYKKYMENNSKLSIKVEEKEISHEEYIENLLRSVYVVSPPGNGLDCYRTLEALYCGAVPIIADNYVANAYDGLPIIKIKNFGYLEQLVSQIGYKIFDNDLDGTKADFGFWREKIKNETVSS